MRLDVMAIWLLPAFCEDLTAFARSGENLSTAGSIVVSAFVWLAVVALWMTAVSIFARRERKKAMVAALSIGFITKMNGHEYLIIPTDPKMMEAEYCSKMTRISRQ